MDLAHWLLWSGPLLKNRHEIKPFPVEWATLFVSSRNLLHGIVVARSSPFSFSGGLSAALLFTDSSSIESTSSPQLDPHVHVPAAASVNGLCNFLICTEPRQSSVGLLKTRTSSQYSYTRGWYRKWGWGWGYGPNLIKMLSILYVPIHHIPYWLCIEWIMSSASSGFI